ncbi:MAG: STAS domain-containing protein [bacterium]|nr:STAS domain-containing protein [bacterium]
MERSLNIDITEQYPIAIVRLGGFLGQLEVYKLKKQVDNLMDLGRRYLICDLTEAEFIDSAGIGSIIQIRSRCNQSDGQLYVVGPRDPHLAYTLASSTMSHVIKFFPTLDAALAQMRLNLGLTGASSGADGGGNMTKLIERIDKVLERLERIESLLASEKPAVRN